jgi:parallel beta-helix repeat protein
MKRSILQGSIMKKNMWIQWVAFFFTVSSVQAATYYVSPGKDTIQPVRDSIRSVNSNMTEDIIVYLRGGTYWLDDTLMFDQRDSGTNGHNIIYEAYPGERPILSGGSQITGWTLVGNGVYKAPIGSLRFRQLYVNGKAAVRAREPEVTDYYRVLSWDTTTQRVNVWSQDIARWSRLNEVEMVTTHHWLSSRYLITDFSISGRTASVSIQTPLGILVDEQGQAHNPFTPPYSFWRYNNPYYFENAFEFLDMEGEWYVNPATSEVFYKACTGEDVASAQIIAPKLQHLIKVVGSREAPAHHIQFHGITFEHSTWTMPSQGIFGSQITDVVARITGAFHLENANNVLLERNTFRNIGGGGIVLYSRTNDNVIRGNILKDISGSAIIVDLAGAVTNDWVVIVNPSSADASSRNVISNNYITRAGIQYSGVGIGTIYADGTIVEHNELVDMPYSGISIGWGSTEADTTLKNNSVRYNRIHRVMNFFDDGAGIYTLSKQPGTMINENYIYDIAPSAWASGSPIAGIYLDEGSSAMVLKNNVVENVPVGLNMNMASGNTIINFLGTAIGSVSSNAFVTDNSLSTEAVKANAGLESRYRDIRYNASIQSFATEFGRTGCNTGCCAEDPDGDGDVDGKDLAAFSAM